MINLLPDEAKVQITAARVNVVLFRYIIIICIGGLFLAAISVGAYALMGMAKASAESVITENTDQTSGFGSVQAQAQNFTTNLTNAKTILSKEVLYTKILTDLAAALPAGVIIDKLTLTSASLNTPFTLQAYAATNEQAIALKDNLQQSPLFSSVSFKSLANTGGANAALYPWSVSIEVTINAGAVR